jgi:hypothetical protein
MGQKIAGEDVSLHKFPPTGPYAYCNVAETSQMASWTGKICRAAHAIGILVTNYVRYLDFMVLAMCQPTHKQCNYNAEVNGAEDMNS